MINQFGGAYPRTYGLCPWRKSRRHSSNGVDAQTTSTKPDNAGFTAAVREGL